MADDLRVDVGVPDVGDIVEYSMHGRTDRYRVTSWLRERLPPPQRTDETSMSGMYEDILYQAQQTIKGKKLRYCWREEATFVGLAGVGGTIAPVDKVKVVGRVNWPESHINEARQHALNLAEEGEVVF